MRIYRNILKIDNADNILIIRPLYHCAVLTGEFLISLIKGVNICFYDDGFNPCKIIKYAIDNSITVMCGTPTMFRVFAMLNGRLEKHFAPKAIALSGECLAETTARLIRSAFPDTDIYNVYGLTEASPRVAYLPPEYFDEYPEAVGYTLESVNSRIADENDKELPRNTVGELQILGGSVMSGYYNDKTATEHALRGGWLHTGDLAYVDDNGFMYIKGRKDNMIIRAGINIYPQEIENLLKSDKRVAEVLAYGISDTACGQKVALKVAGEFNSINEVFELCRKLLPEYELPQHIEIVNEIPKNASGKIKRRK